MTAGAGIRTAICFAISAVCSGLWERYSGMGGADGLGQVLEDVGGDDRDFAHCFGRVFTGLAVEPGGCDGGVIETSGVLSGEAGDQAREDVAAAGGGHGGSARGVDPDFAVGGGDDGALALQQHS